MMYEISPKWVMGIIKRATKHEFGDTCDRWKSWTALHT